MRRHFFRRQHREVWRHSGQVNQHHRRNDDLYQSRKISEMYRKNYDYNRPSKAVLTKGYFNMNRILRISVTMRGQRIMKITYHIILLYFILINKHIYTNKAYM